MRNYPRRSTPRVVAGRVQKKNAWDRNRSNYYDVPQQRVVIDRKRPGAGYRHVLTKRDVETFLRLLPDWDTLSQGLNAIVLAPGEWDVDGYHVPGVVHVCAWEAGLWRSHSAEHHEAHRDLLERLGVPCEPRGGGYVLCRFDASQVRAYQLLHVLLHELGHHRDRMTTRSQRRAGRGEPYAEAYARRYEALVWDHYGKAFD